MNDGFHIMEIIHIEGDYPCAIIHFVAAKNLRSGKFKIPQKIIKSLGFYEVKITNNEVADINLSSKTAFEITYKNKIVK